MPHIRFEVVFVEVVAIVAVIATKHVHVFFVHNARVRVARARSLLRIGWFELLPGSRRDVVPVEIIYTIIAIVAAEDKNASTVHNCGMSVTWTGRLWATVGVKLRPGVRGEVELIEVVAAIGAVVATKYVKVIIDGNRGVKGAWTRRVYLVRLRLLDLMPSVHLLEQMLVGATNDVGAVEEGSVQSASLLEGKICACCATTTASNTTEGRGNFRCASMRQLLSRAA